MSTKKMIFAENGKPFTSKESAFKYQINGKLMDHTLIKHGGGWALALTEDLFVEEDKTPKRGPMKYHKVIFSPRLDKTFPEQVEISCNNVCYVAPRGVETIMPASHLEIARNSKYEVHTYNEKKARMESAGYMMKYPYQDLGEVTEKEFKAFLAAGNKICKAEDNNSE